MPFTLSHAAAVLPGVRGDGTGRGRLVPTVLVAGSFAPDMTYYAASVLSGAMEFGDFTHSFTGVLTFDVLVAWALAGAWLVLREPLVALLPRARQGRVAALLRCGVPRARMRASAVLWWYVSAALGALTHVVWDAFTHHDRWGIRLFPVLGQEAGGFPLYWFLQYGSSAVAAVVIAVFVVVALRRVPLPTPSPSPSPSPSGSGSGSGFGGPAGVPVLSGSDRWVAGAVIGGCAVVAAMQRASRWWEYWGATAKPWELIPTLCFGAGAGLVLGTLLYAVGIRVRRPAAAGGAGAGTEAGVGDEAGAGARTGNGAGKEPSRPAAS
ncbi:MULTISPECIES: DUF4184 family protein [Streptomyces]|uniref:DUF4184 domain-containing protein n=1 Tax=Streptomyces avermitilis TaxID=33903 RepID=A0A4D4M442_STRAX|nr:MULTISPECIES: DUF4184 family protein [Streptomyces]MYT01779.1 DUF4184 family protein [Streptomyces sp. SID5469]BBJ54454.1 hypothetical protein SAVMC3_70830 [Streptomyces avermitilis]GDY66457.1 hypothetical protein SAV14893_058500 [Streptomyces avermitilis]GDY73309.1 hypothetical protein SAV31267_027940 [Streptomyces avermitilis]GDY82407.1 hypothetical protein SAVCW2_16060 [Streptomyces avermitilis]